MKISINFNIYFFRCTILKFKLENIEMKRSRKYISIKIFYLYIKKSYITSIQPTLNRLTIKKIIISDTIKKVL